MFFFCVFAIFIYMRKRKYTKEFLLPVVKQSTNYTELLRNLGLNVTGGTHRLIKGRVREYEIDTSHFTGQGWNRGKTKYSDDSVKQQSIKVSFTDDEVFKNNSGYPTSKLFNRLIMLGWENKCSCCNISEWLNKPLRLHVDHKNGNHSDNRLENLRFLCPNCHQQTDTWGCKMKRA